MDTCFVGCITTVHIRDRYFKMEDGIWSL